jgi:hypothetical protein
VRELAVERVDRDDQRHPGPLEVVHRRVAVVDAPAVDNDHCAERADREVVPHEAEPGLSRGAEQVELEPVVDGDPTEVHRDRGGHLAVVLARVVDADRQRGHLGLGRQGRDL